MSTIPITDSIAIDERELSETFLRAAAGPGGQNVNKVATAVELRFDIRHSNLPEPVRVRLERVAGSRVSNDGVLLIRAQRFRTLERNRQDARERLIALLHRAAIAPKPRRPTRPSLAAKEKRLEAKNRRSETKAGRTRPTYGD